MAAEIPGVPVVWGFSAAVVADFGPSAAEISGVRAGGLLEAGRLEFAGCPAPGWGFSAAVVVKFGPVVAEMLGVRVVWGFSVAVVANFGAAAAEMLGVRAGGSLEAGRLEFAGCRRAGVVRVSRWLW